MKGYIGKEILKTQSKGKQLITVKSVFTAIKALFSKREIRLEGISMSPFVTRQICCPEPVGLYVEKEPKTITNTSCGCSCKTSGKAESVWQWEAISREIMNATVMVAKFMGIAFLITALITFYLPGDLLTGLVSLSPTMQVILSTLIGIPMYTSNITALPVVGGLMELGMNKGAALSFLIAGATTTLPAMVAVWGITKKKVFLLYLSFALFGSLLAGLLFNFLN